MRGTGVQPTDAVENLFLKTLNPKPWVLPPLSNSWIIIILWLYIALDRTPNIDCYWGVQYPT